MPEPDRITTGTETLAERTASDFVSLAGGATEDELAGPDRGLEHSALYAVVFLVLVAGSMLLRTDELWETGSSAHSIMESTATILAFLVGALALVRYYSRKQSTFLLIGCGFLGAGLLGLNHAITTTDFLVEARTIADDRVEPAGLYAWTWTAERVFLSLFLFVSLFAWRQEEREGREETIPELSVYLTALVLTVSNMLFFEYTSVRSLSSFGSWVSRPAEFVPAAFFAMAFIGYYRKGSWKRDQFEHWMLVSLLISVVAHAVFMAFSEQRFDAMFDAAHLLKITSYVAILTGLLSSVHATFAREARVLEALQSSNDALAREVEFRAKTEQAVKESSERLQGFLDDANDLIQRVTLEGRFLYVNSSWKRVLGYSDDDLDRMKVFEIVHPAHRDAFEAELKRVVEGEAPRRYDVDYVAADGRLVMLSSSTQVQIVGGNPVATQSILRDVTEQRLAEWQLDESQRNLEALVENTGDSIWSVDRNGRLITLNSAFSLAIEAQTGREPMAGHAPTDVFPSEDVEWYEELYSRTLSGERSIKVRSDYVDGHRRDFEVYANPIHSLEGVSGAVFFGKDVTARERAEEALRVAKEEAEAANKAKSDFLANMSHELRTPLNSVIGFTNILLKNKEERLNERDVGFLSRVLSNGKHLLALINEVLDLAKVEAGRMELIIEEVDLADLCVETVQQLEGQAKSKDGDVVLRADVPETVSVVETDSAKLKQVIINLVGNALKFTHQGSVTVRLELAPDGKTPTAIAVSDTGIGIARDRLDAIFEAFQQAEAGTSRKYGGTGLGLALSRSICLLMGYDLIVESELGEGSTFKIVLGERAERPVMAPHPEDEDETEAGDVAKPAIVSESGESSPVLTDSDASSAGDARTRDGSGAEPRPGESASGVAAGEGVVKRPPPPKPVDGLVLGPDLAEPVGGGVVAEGARPARGPQWGNFKVLVVDDERDSRVLITHYLEDFGCQVFTAADGAEGLRLATEILPDLITLDLIMPEMTGWEVLRRLKGDPRLRAIPVVVVSVVASEGRGKLLGAVDLVAKPFEREDLLRVLWRNLGRRRGGRVLLMVDQRERLAALRAVAEERGLEVAETSRGDFISILGAQSPDLAVLDMACLGSGGVASLLELREDRLLTGLPVLVLTHSGLTEEEHEMIQELATIHAHPIEGPAMLERLIDLSLPLEQVHGADG